MLRYRIKKWWKEHQQVKVLKRGIKELDKKYDSLIAKSGEEYEERLIDDYIDEVSIYRPRLDYLKTQKLLRKASKLGIEVKPEWGNWFIKQENVYTEQTYLVLSDIGEAKVRNLIRKQKREDMEWWLKIIGALTGLVGTIIGLVAILK
jgi:hypothetical protein